MQYYDSAWVDTISDRLEQAISLGTQIPREYVFFSLADPREHAEHITQDCFVTIAPVNFPVDSSMTAGAGRPHLIFLSKWRISLFFRLGQDQEMKDIQLIRGRSGKNFARRVYDLIAGIHLKDLDNGANLSPLTEPCRVESVSWHARTPKLGWAWAEVDLSVKFRLQLSAT